MKIKLQLQGTLFFILFTFSGFLSVQAQSKSNDSIILAAREIIKANNYCALVTLDSSGLPHIRTMNPFPLGDDLTIWFATARTSRKVTEIKKDERVSVYYADHSNAKGYVSITGKAEVIDDKELLIEKKRQYWESIPNWQERFVLIKVKPLSVDVINYEREVYNDPVTLQAPSVKF